jgi:hypothetical protein
MRFGPSLDVVHEYETFLLERDRTHPAVEDDPDAKRASTPVRIREIVVCDRSGTPRNTFSQGDDIIVRLRIEADDPLQPVHVLVGVNRSADDLQCFAVATHDDGLPPLVGRSEYDLQLLMTEIPLLRGDYAVIAYAGDENAITVYDRRDLRPGFTMTGERFQAGLIGVPHRWEEAGAVAAAGSPRR